MKHVLTALVLLAITSLGTSAQGSEPAVQHQSGATALLFDLKGLSDLGASNYRGGLGAMTFVSNNVAVRAGVGVSNSVEKKNNASDEEITTMGFTIAPGVRYNVYNNANVAFYAGGEVLFGLGEVKNEAGGSQVGKVATTTIGGGAFAGAEWFPWRNVSLMLEYGFGYQGTTSKITGATGVEVDGPEQTDLTLGLSSANFTLAWYFN